MKKEKILLFGGNFYPEPTGIGKYNGEMIEWLAKEGHSCTVITTFPYYPHWKVQKPYTRRSYWFKTETLPIVGGVPVKIIRCPHYIPKNPSGFYRILSELSFFFCAYLVLLVLLFKKGFNYVITVAPPFEIGLLGFIYQQLKGAKFIYHIQDLQIDAARHLEVIKKNGLIRFFFAVERFILHHADYISTISHGMKEKVKGKCNKDAVIFPNWVNTNEFYPLPNKSTLKQDFGFKQTDTVILYAGAIGHKQGLELLLQTAKRLKSFVNLKFAICGCGPYKEKLVKIKEEMDLQNVVFMPLQPLSKFNSFLNMADIHLVLQKKGASDLMLPSKLSTILSVGGVAIVTANIGTSLYNIVNSTNMGILIEPDDHEALATAIKDSNIELAEKSGNARTYAEANLASGKILNEYFSKIFDRDEAGVENNTVLTNAKRITKSSFKGIVTDRTLRP